MRVSVYERRYKLITVKVTPMGGYIMGDGDLPKGFDADAFLKKCLRYMGNVNEYTFTDTELAAIDAMVDDTPATHSRKKPTVKTLEGFLQ